MEVESIPVPKKRRKHDPGLKVPAGAEGARSRENAPVSGHPGAPGQVSFSPPISAPGAQGKVHRGGLLRAAWRNAKVFSGPAADSGGAGEPPTLLWPRWLVLRAVGLVFVFIFAGILTEGQALIGPYGIAPLASYFAELKRIEPSAVAAFFKAPGLFWLGTSAGMVTALAWAGLLAAIAVVLNLWPRLTLFASWLVFLSFVTSWGEFSPAQLDGLMLEAALLCVAFAPAGLRPGLGAASPPRPIAVFVMRWMLFRVMVESGIVKLLSDDPHWRQLTAMDVMYETSPSPTVLGFWVHQLPHAYHVFEIAFTFAAELLAPALAVFGGRRGRWIAFVLWTLLQIGIQLTCNFGWLNTAAVGLGLLLLDDQMLLAAAEKLRLPRLRRTLAERIARHPFPDLPSWRLYGLRAALGLHFSLTVIYFARACGVPIDSAPPVLSRPLNFFAEFRSANGYHLYANFDPAHFQVDLEGSNDAGKTWRTYPLRYLPQAVDRRPPFTAPYFARFEATLQIQSTKTRPNSVFRLVAAHLLARTPAVITLFEGDPFPDRPPTIVRMRLYRLTFVDRETHRRTGHYWHKEFAGDYLPAIYLDERGGFASFDLKEADAVLTAGNVPRALALYEQQYRLGNLDAGYRMADLLTRGEGVPAQLGRVFAIFSDLADRGEVKALHNLGICYEQGIGVAPNTAKAAEYYRAAAGSGNLASIYALGVLAAEDRLVPRDDVEGLAFLLRATQQATGDDPLARFIREEGPPRAKQLAERMSAGDIAKARQRANEGR
jgi:lipase maturation factor 1